MHSLPTDTRAEMEDGVAADGGAPLAMGQTEASAKEDGEKFNGEREERADRVVPTLV